VRNRAHSRGGKAGASPCAVGGYHIHGGAKTRHRVTKGCVGNHFSLLACLVQAAVLAASSFMRWRCPKIGPNMRSATSRSKSHGKLSGARWDEHANQSATTW